MYSFNYFEFVACKYLTTSVFRPPPIVTIKIYYVYKINTNPCENKYGKKS